MKIYEDYISKMENELSPEEVAQAKHEAVHDVFLIKLSELRKMQGIRQNDLKTFSQSGISKLESRKDVKISTLISYMSELGMGIEIKVYPRGVHDETQEIVLVKS